MQIKVMADYDCPPLWWDKAPRRVGPIMPEELGLPTELCADLLRWAEAYDATLVRDDPARSGFPSQEAEREFKDRGKVLALRVADALGGSATVRYHV